MDGTERLRRDKCGTVKKHQPWVDIWEVECHTQRTERWHGTAEEIEQFGVDGLIWGSIFQGKEQKSNEKRGWIGQSNDFSVNEDGQPCSSCAVLTPESLTAHSIQMAVLITYCKGRGAAPAFWHCTIKIEMRRCVCLRVSVQFPQLSRRHVSF